ncbi:MAG: methyl-accepting chemotaxis protein [Deltaproteobacteria bacterium]|nr:methyl-accepting chemotaxis protein [Deltaproteobacteria bacterium]
MAQKYKRKWTNYIVDWDLQFRIISQSLIYMFFIVLITVGVILSPLIYDMVFSTNLDVQYQSAQTFLVLVKRLIPAIIVVLVLFTVHQIIITHKICGPLVNFSHTFKRLAEGDLTRKIYLRQGDYLKRECDKINDMIDGLSGILRRLIEDHKKLILKLEDIMMRVEDIDTRENIQCSLEILNNEVHYVANTMSVFKLEEDTQSPGTSSQ